MKSADIISIVELGLLCSHGPCPERKLATLFDEQDDVSAKDIVVAIEAIVEQWADKGVEVIKTASGWQMRSKIAFKKRLQRFMDVTPPRLSRPLYTVLAIVAYNQPVTRGDIEEIRGVTTSVTQLTALEELGWVEVTGRRETPGRPLLYATTQKLLDDLGLKSLSDLPTLDEYGDKIEFNDADLDSDKVLAKDKTPAEI